MSEDLFRVQDISTKRFRLKGQKQHGWVDNAFVTPDIDDDHAISYSNTDGFLGRILSPRRITTLFLLILAGIAIVFTRAAHLQVVQGAHYALLADNNRTSNQDIRADRGLIYDRYQKPLVQNVPNFAITVTANALPDDEASREDLLKDLYQEYLIHYTSLSLSEFLSTIEDLRNNRSKADKETIIAQGVKQDHAMKLQIESSSIDGIQVDQFARRQYLTEGPTLRDPSDTTIYPPVKSLSHTLGYLTSLKEGEYEQLASEGYLYNDVTGRSGLEAAYEKELRGTYGRIQKEVDVFGNFKQVLNQQPAIDGLSLQTSLDLEMQRAVENFANNRLAEFEKHRASIIILHPYTGEILSLVSLPTYDNNAFATSISQAEYSKLIENEHKPLFNRAITGEYPSGSIYKPIVATAAIQEGLVSPHTTFFSSGGIRINRWFFPDWRAGGHGITNVYHALADSVNTYFYIIGGGYNDFTGLGVSRITDYSREFGLASTMNIDLPGESSGFLPSKQWKEEVKKERWYVGDTYHLSIGQGDLLVTPLQMAVMSATFANGGTVYRPHLVTGLLDKNLVEQTSISPVVLNDDFIDPVAIAAVQAGLRRVVTQGSGRRLGDLAIQAAGKTGTAQWNTQKDPHSWFMGYAPYDKPEVAFVVMVEEGGEGSGVSLSIAKDFLQWWGENRSIE